MEQLFLPGFHQAALPPAGFVYFGSRGGFIKIGFSLSDPLGRCRRLGLTPLLMISGTLSDEKDMHARFRKSHSDREWFLNTPEIAAFIAEHANTTIDMLRRAA